MPIAVINLGLPPQQLLLSILIRPVASDLIAVVLRLQQGCQVYPRPHLLAPELAVLEIISRRPEAKDLCERRRSRGGVLQLMYPYRVFVPAISHDEAGAEEVIPRAETTGGEVALWGVID